MAYCHGGGGSAWDCCWSLILQESNMHWTLTTSAGLLVEWPLALARGCDCLACAQSVPMKIYGVVAVGTGWWHVACCIALLLVLVVACSSLYYICPLASELLWLNTSTLNYPCYLCALRPLGDDALTLSADIAALF